MKQKIILAIAILSFFSLVVFVSAQSGGPVQYGECGDNVCDYGENTPSYPYYCPQDCDAQENECETIGLRQEDKYCSPNKTLEEQKETDVSCDNNFECESNLCVNDKCVSGNLWAKFIRWLSKIFG